MTGVGSQRSEPWEFRRKTELVLLITILAIAAWLRIRGLKSLPFEQDELYTLYDSLAFWHGGRGGGPGVLGRPVYYLIESVLLRGFEPGPLVLRLPAAMFGVAGVLTTWHLGRSVAGPVTGLFAAFLVTISPWHLYASQFGRYWTLVYLMSSLAATSLFRALQSNSRRAYGATLAATVVGFLAHPSFLFAFAGMAVGVNLTVTSGRIAVMKPTLRGLKYLWGPLFLFILADYGLLQMFNKSASLSNLGTRGMAASLRLVPGMVQWAGPATIIAGVASVSFLAVCDDERLSRWAFMAAGGALSAIGLLVAASFFTGVYADYGISALPLLFVSIGAAIALMAETMTGIYRHWFIVGAAATLFGAVLPGTVSHMADGTRFDYRSALEHIREERPDGLVVGWPSVLMRYYAPDLHHEELQVNTAYLDDKLKERNGLWLITSVRRYGMVGDEGTVTRWIDSHCRRKLRTEKQRFDYRQYRVELYWCEAERAIEHESAVAIRNP